MPESNKPEWMSGFVKLFKQHRECCLVDEKREREIIFTHHSGGFMHAHRPHPIRINRGRKERPGDESVLSTVNSY